MVMSSAAGDLDAAFAAAKHAADQYEQQGALGANWSSLWISVMQPFREDPRFQHFVRRLKLMDYWKVHGPPDDCTLAADRIVCKAAPGV